MGQRKYTGLNLLGLVIVRLCILDGMVRLTEGLGMVGAQHFLMDLHVGVCQMTKSLTKHQEGIV